jgi:quercetin dioxygenase-like cupin family protein
MRLKRLLLTASALGALAFRAGLGAQEGAARETALSPPASEDRVVPVHDEPRHRQMFQSGTTRVLELRVLPGDMSLFHSHHDPVLYVNFATGGLRTQDLGKDWSQPAAGRGGRAGGPAAPPAAAAPAPAVTAAAAAIPARPLVRVSSTTSYVERPVTHRIMNTGTSMVRALVLVNQTAGNDATTQKDAGFDGVAETAEMTNTWYRAYRFTLAPGQVATHRHTTQAFLAQTTEGTATAQGARLWALNEPAAWAFFEAGDRHEVRNTGAGPLELVEIEVRQPAR